MTDGNSDANGFDQRDLVPGSDRLPVRTVGAWSKDKHHFLARYIDAFTKAMKGKPAWTGIGYVDLFAGPGMCVVRDTGEEIDASPLLALQTDKPFDVFAYADKSEDSLHAILSRFGARKASTEPLTFQGDCNQRIDDIAKVLPRGHLYLAFLDPTGLDIHFETIRALTANHRVDLIVVFMDRLDLNRNIAKTYYDTQESKLDAFFGAGSNWRSKFADLANWTADKVTELSLDIYRKQLRTIGYECFGKTVRIIGKAGAARTPFYLLFFASKHPLGAKIWNSTSSVDRGGQRGLYRL